MLRRQLDVFFRKEFLTALPLLTLVPSWSEAFHSGHEDRPGVRRFGLMVSMLQMGRWRPK